LVAANEKLEAAVKYQQGDHEVSDANSQCDLSTEFYEKLLFEEKQRFDLLNEELCLKTSQITELTTTLNETKSNLDAEVNGLKRNISILQVLSYI
jgi:hypothetical protein